jgi:hypothetical protein
MKPSLRQATTAQRELEKHEKTEFDGRRFPGE